MTARLSACSWVKAGCVAALVGCGPVSAEDPQAAQQDQATEEVAVTAERQTALDNEALTVSETPDAGPHLEHPTEIVGLGALYHPVYDGSKKNQTSPFPYLDIRGVLGDRLFVSSLEGLGVKILNDGLVRAGIAINYASGRTSSDDPHLRGLPDISGAAQVSSYVALALKPFVVEAKVQQRLGGSSGTSASLGAAVNLVPTPQLHLTLSTEVVWLNSTYMERWYGVTPQESASAGLQGNPLPPYTAKAGISTVSFTAAGVYQVTRHWGIVGRLSVNDLVGSQAKNSPLTQRNVAPAVGFGAMYLF
jgi:outer membrane scaffolding protein for murein synthesis (MipA/OmpV family)